MTERLTSLQNPRIKQAVKLRDKRERDRTQTFLIEGFRELTRAARGNAFLLTVFFSPAHFLGSNEESLIEEIREKGVEIIEVTEEVFAKLSYRDRPDGLLAIGSQSTLNIADLETPALPFFLIAESIEKPGNLGSILRSSDAAGVDALLVCDRCTDVYNPNVVRASVGTLFTVPVLELSSEEAITYLKEHRIRIVATSPDSDSPFTESDLTGPIAIAVGTEQLGLSTQWMEAADTVVKIPMNGVADSLNVAAATTLLLYEVLRQRN
ncbi:MAG: 23S rRNA (uridine(2479)-2'-O)-methyltransferase [Chlamydiae bacterium]|nr:23S rRNA (uridine(2479)-2'-O)-methyltransferase [Chlamydiota bacterium]